MNKKFLDNVVVKTLLLSSFLMILICIVFNIAPFGNSTFLTGDLNGQYITFFTQIRNAFLEGDGLFYSLYKSLGGSMAGIIAYYTSSPFTLLYILTPPVFYGELTTIVISLKIVLMCSAMAFFISKKLETNSDKIILFSLSYGFSGYAFAYLQNFMWHDVLILLPLLCYGVDVLIKTKRPFIYSLFLFLAIFSNFYIAYMACIFIVLYFFYSLLQENNLNLKNVFIHCKNFFLASLLGGLMSAMLLFPAIFDVNQNKGISGGFSFQFTTDFQPIEFLTRLFPFAFNWDNLIYDLPNVYSGIITLIFAIAFFFAKNINAKQKVLSFIMLTFLFFSMYFTDLMFIFHGFRAPVWFSHRHSFLFIFWLCFLGANAFIKGEINKKLIAIITSSMIFLLAVRYIVKDLIFTPNRFLATAFITIAFIVLIAYSNKFKKLSVGFMILILIGELFLNTYYTHRQFEKYSLDTYKNFISDNEYLIDATHTFDGSDDFRMEKNFFRSLNDSLALNYYGLSHFSSIQDTNANMHLSALNVYEFYNGYIVAKDHTIFSHSVLGVKYLIVDPSYNIPHGYVKTDISYNGLIVYQNPYALSLSFVLPYSPDGYDIESSNTKEFISNFYNLLTPYSNKEDIYNEDGSTINLDALKAMQEYLNENSADANYKRGSIEASITAKEDGLLFMSIPYSEHLKILVNDEEVLGEKVFDSQLAVPITKGDNQINISYKTPMLTTGIIVSILSFSSLGAWYFILKKKGSN